jgi:8-oxo-dGTP pyrophosphatase MutT (NUDIX family)
VAERPDLEGLRIRPATRAVVLDPDDRVLLVRFEFPTRTVWATPGGGQEPGEDDDATLRRELDEEHGQCENVYLQRTSSFVPAPTLSWAQLRAERVHELRWWTVPELLAAGADGVSFAPRDLPALVAELVTNGPPAVPFDVGI